jgi:hypothetical protein
VSNSAYDTFPRTRPSPSVDAEYTSTETETRPPSALPMSSDDSFADRISSFVSGNRRGIVIGAAAAAVAIGGVAYYVASSRAASGVGDEESFRDGKKKDKKKKKHRKSGKDKDGPILEERKPQATEESDEGLSTAQFQCVARSLTDPFFLSRTRPTLNGGTDPGARNGGMPAPSSFRAWA